MKKNLQKIVRGKKGKGIWIWNMFQVLSFFVMFILCILNCTYLLIVLLRPVGKSMYVGRKTFFNPEIRSQISGEPLSSRVLLSAPYLFSGDVVRLDVSRKAGCGKVTSEGETLSWFSWGSASSCVFSNGGCSVSWSSSHSAPSAPSRLSISHRYLLVFTISSFQEPICLVHLNIWWI